MKHYAATRPEFANHFLTSRSWSLLPLKCALAALLVAAIMPVQARADLIGIGAATNYAVLGLCNTEPTCGTAHTAIDLTSTMVDGNVGISLGGTIVNAAPSTINGSVFQQGSGQYSGPGTVTGSIIANSSNVTLAVTDAFLASTTDGALTPTQVVSGNITSARTFTGNGGLNVVNINGNINLTNANIMLSGGTSDIFVINVTGSLTLAGTASLLSSGVPIGNVLWNFTGCPTTTPGCKDFSTVPGSTLNGTILAPDYNLSHVAGIWLGSIIGGPSSIGLVSGATVIQAPFSPPIVPEPASLLLLGVGGGLLGIAAAMQRKRRTA